jgi:alpha-glucosidase (family GH31 glycosyl hydrolase)
MGADEELFVMWLEAAVFTTHFRVHNSVLTGVRMPWSFGAATENTWRELAALHVRARPLIARLWHEAETSGAPPVRPIWFDEFDKSAGAHADDEWMVGADVLVAPVLQQGAVSRSVWFPRGCWHLHSDQSLVYMGPSEVVVDAPLRTLPWFTRCGSSPLAAP